MRLAAVVAAVLLAVLSRGDVFSLAAVLAVAAWRPASAVALAAALGATAWRFASTSLEAVAGVQAVLGAAGALGPTRGAVASWLAAVVIIFATPPPAREQGRPGAIGAAWFLDLLAPVAFGASTALVVAGPAPGGELWVRVVAGIVATVLAFFLCRLVPPRWRDAIAVAAGVASLAVVAGVAPAWSGAFDRPALEQGAALSVAAGALCVAASGSVAALGRRRS